MHRLTAGLLVRALGLGLGVLADAALGDPRRRHPVAGFGQAAAALERRVHRDDRAWGALYTGVCVGGSVGVGWLAERVTRDRAAGRVLLTAAATWIVLGGASLAREGQTMARLLEAGDLDGPRGARARLSHLCARDGSQLPPAELARATVESLAENVSDAVVAPLFWGAFAGVPGLLGYRAANTLDAMVGYRSPRHLRFGWASARLDDVLNLAPSRLSGLLLCASAPVVGGSPTVALAVLRRDRRCHPSPNAGHPEAAAAGALGVALGGANSYQGRVEQRPLLGGHGRAVEVADVRRAVRLTRAAAALAAGLAVFGTAAWATGWPAPNSRCGRRRNE